MLLVAKLRDWVNTHTPDFGLEGDVHEPLQESRRLRAEMEEFRYQMKIKKWLEGEPTGNPLRDPMIRRKP